MLWYVEKGKVTDSGAHEDKTVSIGDTEWQFGDAVSGERSMSYDYCCSLESAINAIKDIDSNATFRF